MLKKLLNARREKKLHEFSLPLLRVDKAKHVHELCQAGADPNVRGGECDTPLLKHVCDPVDKSSLPRKEAIVEALLDYKADPNIQNDNGISPLMAVRTPKMALLLMRNGADETLRTCLSLSGKTVFTKPKPLVKKYSNSILKVILEEGGDPNTKDNDGDTGLHALAWDMSEILYDQEYDDPLVKTYLACGADPSIKNEDGFTAYDFDKYGIISYYENKMNENPLFRSMNSYYNVVKEDPLSMPTFV